MLLFLSVCPWLAVDVSLLCWCLLQMFRLLKLKLKQPKQLFGLNLSSEISWSLLTYFRTRLQSMVACNRTEGFTTAWEIKLEAGLPGYFLLRNLSCLHTTIFAQSTFISQKSVPLNLNLRNKLCWSFKIGALSTRHQSLPARSGTGCGSEEGGRQVEKVVNSLCPSE